jgi:hypothetical protein
LGGTGRKFVDREGCCSVKKLVSNCVTTHVLSPHTKVQKYRPASAGRYEYLTIAVSVVGVSEEFRLFFVYTEDVHNFKDVRHLKILLS